MKRVLICGLPGSGKTTLGKALVKYLHADLYDGDEVREAVDDWDFSMEGRERQMNRMIHFTKESVDRGSYGVAAFVCPTDALRKQFDADYVIWMNTVLTSDYDDTNAIFEKPSKCDLEIPAMSWWMNEDDLEEHVNSWARAIARDIASRKFDPKKPTVQMLGRWQPWHEGHTALFMNAWKQTNQVAIMVRDTGGNDDSNPFDFDEISKSITDALFNAGFLCDSDYTITLVPNIVDISYGRGVGYTFTEHDLGEEIHKISATSIREQMKNGEK